MLRKYFHQYWLFECPDAIMTTQILKAGGEKFLVFGGHDKTLYLMDDELMIADDVVFDGWVRCSYPIDLDGDGNEEVLVGAGDGRVLVLKLDEKKKKFIGIMNKKFGAMIDCCTAGDFYRDGNIELIFGGEDKSLNILNDINSNEPIATFYYDSWVTSCALGFLKFPQFAKPVYGLVVGNKSGFLQLIHVKDGKPEILWQKNVYAQINDIKVGDVTNDGYNEIIVAADDFYVKIYNSEGKRLRFIKIEEFKSKLKKKRVKHLNRPITLLIEDIDGDNTKEIIVGCADGTLRVFHNPHLDSTDFELKWKVDSGGSIKEICSYIDTEFEPNLRHIVFGGYRRVIRNIADFEWGKKNVLKIPRRFNIPEIAKKAGKETGDDLEIKPVPTNLRDYIIKLLEDKGSDLTLDLLINELIKAGYSKSDVEDEIKLMKSLGVVQVSLVSEEIEKLIEKRKEELKKMKAKEIEFEEEQENDEETLNNDENKTD